MINTFTNLNLLSSIDYKIKLQPWVDQAIKHIPGMTETDAAVYFQSYRTLLSEIDGAPGDEVDLASYQVDVRCFGLFIALQLYSSKAKMSDSRQNLEKDPWGIKESTNYGSSVNSSPRTKATRSSYIQSEYSLIVAFVKQNLKLLLRLISTDIHNKEVQLSATEFNTLKILFGVRG